MKINQTFKNIKRLQQIASEFMKHGFGQIIEDIGLGKYVTLQNGKDSGKLSAAVRLRMTFMALGPTFIKLGQMLSIRPDLIPQEFVEEFRKLQDKVTPLPFKELKNQIEKELDTSLDDVYDQFNEEPIGCASIAQVYRAKLKSGEDVVVKVRRPGIQHVLETDVSILFTIAKLLERYVPAVEVINPVAIVNEFARIVRLELDFINEAQNIDRFSRNFEEDEKLEIPNVIWELTGVRVLTMDYLEGLPLSDTETLKKTGWDLKKLVHSGAQSFLKMVFVDGFFHGDIHGGNILFMGPEKVGLLDFGIVGHLDDRLKEDIASMFISLITRDFRGIARTYIGMSLTTKDSVSPDALASDLQKLVEPLMGLTLKDINSAQLLMDMASVAQKHKLQIPQDLLLLGRAISSLEGIGRELDPDFNVLEISQDFSSVVLANRYKPERLAVDLITGLRDLADLGRDLPGQLQTILKSTESGNLGFNVRLRDPEAMAALKRESFRLSSAVMTAGGVIAVAIAEHSDSFSFIEFVGILLMVLGVGGFIATIFRKFGKD